MEGVAAQVESTSYANEANANRQGFFTPVGERRDEDI